MPLRPVTTGDQVKLHLSPLSGSSQVNTSSKEHQLGHGGHHSHTKYCTWSLWQSQTAFPLSSDNIQYDVFGCPNHQKDKYRLQKSDNDPWTSCKQGSRITAALHSATASHMAESFPETLWGTLWSKLCNVKIFSRYVMVSFPVKPNTSSLHLFGLSLSIPIIISLSNSNWLWGGWGRGRRSGRSSWRCWPSLLRKVMARSCMSFSSKHQQQGTPAWPWWASFSY